MIDDGTSIVEASFPWTSFTKDQVQTILTITGVALSPLKKGDYYVNCDWDFGSKIDENGNTKRLSANDLLPEERDIEEEKAYAVYVERIESGKPARYDETPQVFCIGTFLRLPEEILKNGRICRLVIQREEKQTDENFVRNSISAISQANDLIRRALTSISAIRYTNIREIRYTSIVSEVNEHLGNGYVLLSIDNGIYILGRSMS